MLRSAAKNHESVTVVSDPMDYEEVAGQITANGQTTLELRRRLAAGVFARTAAYDGQIAGYLGKTFCGSDPKAGEALPASLQLNLRRAQTLRYGENPHQRAALYGRFGDYFQQLHGKELSYNNILDLTAAAALAAEFATAAPTLAILKHCNPCGVGQGDNLREAWEKAFATDKQAPFGGIIACNQPLDLRCAEAIMEIFSEVIVAPDFTKEALELLKGKKNLRLMKALKWPGGDGSAELRDVGAESFLLQDRDEKITTAADWRVVTKRQPTAEERQAMLFGWPVVKHVKSNAIVYAAPDRTLGIGAGQMSRVDASKIAVWKAEESGLSLRGSAVCSDAFFPFADGLAAAARAGATAAIQPGGSVRDAEVIAAADEHGMVMVFTGTRHFRH